MTEFVKVASTNQVVPGKCMTVEVSGSRIALFNVDGNVYAMDDTCAHQGGPLGDGSLEGAIVTCPWHGWQYDVSTGACQTNPSVQMACYEVRIDGDDILVTSEHE